MTIPCPNRSSRSRSSTRASDRSTSSTTWTSPSIPARSPPSSATTAPASRPWSSASPASTSIDSGEVKFEGKPVVVQRPARRRRARHRVRLPGPRAGRQPRHHPEHVPGPRDPPVRHARRRRDGAQGARDADRPVGAHRLLGAPARRQPLRWPAADRRHRQGGALEQQGRLPRRADRRARRRPDPPGPRPGPPAGRPGPRRRADLATT